MPQPRLVKTTDRSCEELIRVAESCGFVVVQGGKHCKVKKPTGEHVTTIPRHNPLNRYTVKGIIDDMKDTGANVEAA